MPTPIIILGAGASHDYSPFAQKISINKRPRKPPLTKQLVEQDFLDEKFLNNYPEVAGLISEIAGSVLREEKTLEACLFEIKNKLGHKLHRQKDFAILQFYLKDLFKDISLEYYNINNYAVLIKKIKDFQEEEKATIVSFNYDTLFEKSTGEIWQDMSSYVGGKIKLIKLHGSHDWAYVGRKAREKLKRFKVTNSLSYIRTYPRHLDSLREQNVAPYHLKEINRYSFSDDSFRFPAIAIPLPEKQHFICPQNHIDVLKEELKQANRILIIGWSASDLRLIEMLENHVKKGTFVTIVSESKESAKKAQAKLDHISNFDFNPLGGGFSKFIDSNDCDKFLA